MLAVVTVISKAFVTVGAAGARVGCMQETEAEGRTDGVETETMKLINKWSEHDLSTQPLCCMFVKKTRGDDDSSQTITRGVNEDLVSPWMLPRVRKGRRRRRSKAALNTQSTTKQPQTG